jgi:hypothetical protein
MGLPWVARLQRYTRSRSKVQGSRCFAPRSSELP